jgi:hypothetical protein
MSSAACSPALVLAWSDAEPHRIGEIAFLREGTKEVKFGRGQDDLMFVRQRPGAITLRPPLLGDGLSREQLLIRAEGDIFEIERIGRCPTLVNGDTLDRARVRAGDAILLRDNLLFYVVSRARNLAGLPAIRFADLPRFGEIDRFGIVGESPAAWALRAVMAEGKSGQSVIVDDLGDRRDDVPLVTRHLLRDMAKTNPDLVAPFVSEAGEVRVDGALVMHLIRDASVERVHHVERFLWEAISHSDGEFISHRPEVRAAPVGPRSETMPPIEPSQEELREALERSGGRVAKAARALGLKNRYELYRLMKKYKLEAIPSADD